MPQVPALFDGISSQRVVVEYRGGERLCPYADDYGKYGHEAQTRSGGDVMLICC